MIRVRKSEDVPLSLQQTSAYNGEDVTTQLIDDQYGKCYLCERVRITDFQIEHHKSQRHHPHLRKEWTNLFHVCSYCNGKKGEHHDDTICPINTNIEEDIEQRVDFNSRKVLFNVIDTNPCPQYLNTIALLNPIFNGKSKLKKRKEEYFLNDFLEKINHFQNLAVNFLSMVEKEEYRCAIEEQLSIDKEFLGFKYWIINGNPVLLNQFREHIIWNK